MGIQDFLRDPLQSLRSAIINRKIDRVQKTDRAIETALQEVQNGANAVVRENKGFPPPEVQRIIDENILNSFKLLKP